MGNCRLYDTDEYSPFIDDVLVPTSADMTIFDPAENMPILAASVAALSRKGLPDVGIADEYKLFSSLRDRNEFLALRKAIHTLEGVFGELVNEKVEFVRQKISIEIEWLSAELSERFDEACSSFGERAKFVTIEMLAGQFAGFLSPWVDKAKEAAAAEKLSRLRAVFLEREDLAGNLFFMMEIWDRHKVLEDERYRQAMKEKKEDTIWGEDESDIPWYEEVPNHATDGNSTAIHSRR